MKSGVPTTDLDDVQNTQIRFVLEGKWYPSYPAIIGLFPVHCAIHIQIN